MAVEFSTTQFCSIATPFPAFSKPTILYSISVCKEHMDITLKCSLQIWKASGINLPTQVAPDVWDSHKTTCSSSKHHNIDMS